MDMAQDLFIERIDIPGKFGQFLKYSMGNESPQIFHEFGCRAFGAFFLLISKEPPETVAHHALFGEKEILNT
ncbi:MAG: hypothetical protein QHI48_03975 [Bacteroidota bacterium]|nr:hypothetical protein [Bacteroidota bacterium]